MFFFEQTMERIGFIKRQPPILQRNLLILVSQLLLIFVVDLSAAVQAISN